MSKFKFMGVEYPIQINYWEAVTVLPEKFKINLTKIFIDNQAAEETMQALVLDDEKTLELAWHYVGSSSSFDKQKFFENMQGKDLDQFREDFWSAVINFSPPLKRNLMDDLWRTFKKELKQADLQNETSDA